ncbi:MAG: hypothetical protein RJB13_856 [Pseudomonadota bacterium]
MCENILRRNLIKSTLSLSASVVASRWLSPINGFAQVGSEDFPVLKKLVWIHMSGGWDILETVDPKSQSTAKLDIMYDFSLAPRLNGASQDVRLGRWMAKTAAHGSDIVVVRGLAMGTTSHDAGSVYADTGVLSNSGNVNAASIPAIVASQSVVTIPLIQVGGGNTPKTDRGLLKPVSIVRAQELELYRKLFPGSADERDASQRIIEYSRRSLLRLQSVTGSHDRLTEIEAARSKIQAQIEADVGSKLLLTDEDRLPFEQNSESEVSRDRANLISNFALVIKLLKNQLVTSVNMSVGGFDTHANQERTLGPRLTNFDEIFATFLGQLKAEGLLNDTLVVLYSDFGRTPKVNSNSGRDHWPVGGALLAGGGLLGGRAVGATDENLLALNVDENTGQASASGIQLSPIHLGGSIIELTLGKSYLEKRPYLESVPALTRLKS